MPITVIKYPAPYGPGTTLAMGSKTGSVRGGGLGFLQMTKSPMVAGVALAMTICAVPFLFVKNPETCNAEHQAAQRAYMRYHNINPIFGASSKQARASEGH